VVPAAERAPTSAVAAAVSHAAAAAAVTAAAVTAAVAEEAEAQVLARPAQGAYRAHRVRRAHRHQRRRVHVEQAVSDGLGHRSGGKLRVTISSAIISAISGSVIRCG
jgi:hypothetical protein